MLNDLSTPSFLTQLSSHPTTRLPSRSYIAEISRQSVHTQIAVALGWTIVTSQSRDSSAPYSVTDKAVTILGQGIWRMNLDYIQRI